MEAISEEAELAPRLAEAVERVLVELRGLGWVVRILPVDDAAPIGWRHFGLAARLDFDLAQSAAAGTRSIFEDAANAACGQNLTRVRCVMIGEEAVEIGWKGCEHDPPFNAPSLRRSQLEEASALRQSNGLPAVWRRFGAASDSPRTYLRSPGSPNPHVSILPPKLPSPRR